MGVRLVRFVYIAAPFTKGTPTHNVHAVVQAADALLEAGFVPFVPHLNALWDMISPKPIEQWYAWDIAWLEKCDALLRLPGESPGADKEVEHMLKLDRSVFYSVESILLAWQYDAPPPAPKGAVWKGEVVVETGEAPEKYRKLLED